MFNDEEGTLMEKRSEKAAKNGMQNFLNKVPQKLLTAQQELDLGTTIQLGLKETATQEEKDAGLQAQQELSTHNLKLVLYVAKQYANYGVSIDDLLQEGTIGLMTAVNKYDPTRGYRFSTAAIPWIKQSILRFLSENRKTIRYPAHIAESLRKIKKAEDTLWQQLERAPTIEEVSALLGGKFTPDKIESLKYVTQPIVSTNAIVGDEEDTELGDLLGDEGDLTPTDYTEKNEAIEQIKKLMTFLNDKQRLIIESRYGLNGREEMTLEQVGEILGITRERVRQLEKEALEFMRSKAESKK